jgi:hypothetical protein
MGQITEHFTDEELTTSGNHPDVVNEPPDSWAPRKLVLAEKLEEMRSILGVKLRIVYAFRCPLLNTLCSGSATSDHMQLRAADVVPSGMTLKEAYLKLWAHPTFMAGVDQLILERGCIHLGIGLCTRKEGRGDRPYPLLAVWPAPLPEEGL